MSSQLKVNTNVCPYKNLFIYHLEGLFHDEDEKYLGKEYLGNWVEDNYSFLFFSSQPGVEIEKIIKDQQDIKLLDKYFFSYEEWQGGAFEKISIENFRIVPPWTEPDAGNAASRIILDPGVVFGNGLHPTTKDCVRAILYLKKHYPFKKVIDIGTGTGILAIVSVYLGADDVTAVDLNPLAVKTACNNVKLNNFSDYIRVYAGKGEDYAHEGADLIIANIHFDVIKSMFSNDRFYNKKYCIFSGLMRTQAEDLRDLIKKQELSIMKEWEYEMTWYTMLVNGRRYD